MSRHRTTVATPDPPPGGKIERLVIPFQDTTGITPWPLVEEWYQPDDVNRFWQQLQLPVSSRISTVEDLLHAAVINFTDSVIADWGITADQLDGPNEAGVPIGVTLLYIMTECYINQLSGTFHD